MKFVADIHISLGSDRLARPPPPGLREVDSLGLYQSFIYLVQLETKTDVVPAD